MVTVFVRFPISLLCAVKCEGQREFKPNTFMQFLAIKGFFSNYTKKLFNMGVIRA